jgi:hypothetical protein
MQGRNAAPSTDQTLRQALAACDRPALATLIERARLLDALDVALRDALPPPLARQCRVANIRGARLVVLASSSTVAARLRTVQTELLDAANRLANIRLSELAVKVAALPALSQSQIAAKPLSTAAASSLNDAAAILADPELRDLLLRMASMAE